MSVKEFIKTATVQDEIRRIGEQYPEKSTILIDFTELERHDQSLADEARRIPAGVLEQFEEEIKPAILTVYDSEVKITVGFKNIPIEYSPRTLGEITERDIGKIMRVEGQIGQVSDKYPFMTEAMFFCNRCDDQMRIQQAREPRHTLSEPSRCKSCGKADFRLAKDFSQWDVAQVMLLMDKPDLLRAGQRPTTLSVFMMGDLTKDNFDLMDKIVIDGHLELAPSGKRGDGNKYIWYLKAYNIEVVNRGFDEIHITSEEEQKILEMGKDPSLLKRIAESIAPTVYGYNELKQALVLQAVGGTEKKMLDSKRRHWLHILAVTDPGKAKSIMANALCSISPRAIYTTGKGTSAAGLTSTAEKDALIGEWMIKPGIIPLASGGLVAIDEFPTLGEAEMDSLLEAMEQGIVTTTKAGKNVRFKAETAVFACGNPKAGRFDDFQEIIPQFGLKPQILSRFDLIFIMRDLKDSEDDAKVAETIFKVHTNQIKSSELDRDLVRKYIAYVKQHFHPIMDKDDPTVVKELKDFYVDLRKQGFANNTISATPRQLEALIRLTEASAKLRMSNKATRQDVQVAKTIIMMSLQQVATDKSGVLDIDVITTGKPKNDRDKIQLITVTIGELSQHGKDVAEYDAILETLQGDIPKHMLDKYLDELKRSGVIYEPRHSMYKLTGEGGV